MTYLTSHRLRASMEGYLDTFNPVESVRPTGIFSSRVEVRRLSTKVDKLDVPFLSVSCLQNLILVFFV